MKKFLSLSLCLALCCICLCGCVGTQLDLTVYPDGKVLCSQFIGYTKDAVLAYADTMEIPEDTISWDDMQMQVVDGIEYWGASETLSLDDTSGNYCYIDESGVSQTGQIPYVPFIYEIAAGQYALRIVYTAEDATVEDESGEEIAIGECRVIIKYTMPTEMKLVNGPSRGIAIEGNIVTVNMLEAAKAITDDGNCEVIIMPKDYTASDVPIDAWYSKVALSVIEKGWMPINAAGEFNPRKAANRADITYALWSMLDSPKVDAVITFEDVPVYERYYDAVRYFYREGIILGYNATKYGAEDAITREQVFTLLHRIYTSYNMGDANAANNGDLSKFVDAQSVSDWAREAVEWGVANGIILGDSNKRLNPKDSISNAEIAALLERFDSMK